MNLLPIDTDSNDDDLLVKFLEDNQDMENIQKTLTTQNVAMTRTVQNIQTNANMLPHVIPKMFFPNSNVTIYYNFK